VKEMKPQTIEICRRNQSDVREIIKCGNKCCREGRGDTFANYLFDKSCSRSVGDESSSMVLVVCFYVYQ